MHLGQSESKRLVSAMTDALFQSSGGPTSPLTPSEPTPAPTPTLFPGFPPYDTHMRVHTILIVIIFCVVCFLLLVAFFYAFCFRCTLEPLPKDRRPAPRCSIDREEATFRRSSSCPSVGNSI